MDVQDKTHYTFGDIFPLCKEWLDEARQAYEDPQEHTSATIATSDGANVSARIVYVKFVSERGFTFFTNYESNKSSQMGANSNVCLNYYWQPLKRQMRILGKVSKILPEESDAYFATRARQSQIGAHASLQSRECEQSSLHERIKFFEDKFDGVDVPRPEGWGGFIVVPNYVEFWKMIPFRLHERTIFKENELGNWTKTFLYP